jgi:predicted Zn-dependent protease
MKMKKLFILTLFFFLAGFLLNACSTPRKVAPPKPTAPKKPVPELGNQPQSKASKDHSQGLVSGLKTQAKKEMKADELNRAFSTLEQALRINPNDPGIWHMLAEIQLRRGNAVQAEQLARKSNLIAGKDKTLRRRNWHIIAEALEQRGLAGDAAAAKRRANN